MNELIQSLLFLISLDIMALISTHGVFIFSVETCVYMSLYCCLFITPWFVWFLSAVNVEVRDPHSATMFFLICSFDVYTPTSELYAVLVLVFVVFFFIFF